MTERSGTRPPPHPPLTVSWLRPWDEFIEKAMEIVMKGDTDTQKANL